MLAILEVQIAAVESRLHLDVQSHHVRRVAERAAVQVHFILAPASEARRVAERIGRIEILRKIDAFDGYRPAFDVLALRLDIDTDLRSRHAGLVGVLGISVRLSGIVGRVEIDGIGDAQGDIGHQVQLRGYIALDINGSDMRILQGRRHVRQDLVDAEFVFVDNALVKDHAHVVDAERHRFKELVLGNASMIDGTAEIVKSVGFEFARLARIETETVARAEVHVHRLGNHELRLHVIRKLIDIGKDAAERAVCPEGATAFLHRLERLFLVIGADRLFVLEKLVLPRKARRRFAFPHGKGRSVCPDDASRGDVSAKDARADIRAHVEFFVNRRGVVVRGMIVENALVVGRNAGRLGRVLVSERTGKVERECEVRPQGHVGIRHGDDIRLEDGVHGRAGLVARKGGRRFRIVEVLDAESHEAGDRHRQIVLAEQRGLHIAGKRVKRRMNRIELYLGGRRPDGCRARSD